MSSMNAKYELTLDEEMDGASPSSLPSAANSSVAAAQAASTTQAQQKQRMLLLETKILTVCRKFSRTGVPSNTLKDEIKGQMTLADMTTALNSLLQKSRIALFQDPASGLVYKEISEDVASKFAGLNAEELMVYQQIEQAGNTGIWTAHMRQKTGLLQTAVQKALKTLESRRLVKSVKSVQDKNKKVYMLFDLEPAREVTGGAWYNEQEFDSEFIQVLLQQTLKFIETRRIATAEMVSEFIRQSGISRVELKIDEIQSIINTLIFDGKVEEVTDARAAPSTSRYDKATRVYYKLSGFPTLRNIYTEIPCARCPVMSECSDDGDVSPATCVYFKKWLEF